MNRISSLHAASRWPALLLASAVAGCAVPPRERPPAPEAPPAAVAPPAAEAPPAAWVAPHPQALPRRPGPIPLRPLDVATECHFRDETGYGGRMKLTVDGAQVLAFDASIDIPRRGMCRFALDDFRQTRGLPNIELVHLREKCIVRMWEQGERVTVAFDQCQRMCSGNAYPYLWPILADRREGSCH